MKENRVFNEHQHEISKQQIIADLKKIGVKEGDHLAVVLSLKSVGYVVGGSKTFIEALLEVVGPTGTLMMNAHTCGFPLSEMVCDYVFDYKSTPCVTGVVPETLRKCQNAFRSRNPLTSVVAIGRFAKLLVEGHDEHSDLYAPYSQLAAIGGKYLCVGLRNNLVAIRHEAQRLAGLNSAVRWFGGVRYIDDGKVRLYTFNQPACVRNLPSLVPQLKANGILKTGKIGFATAYLASTKDLLNGMTDILKADPTKNLCSKLSCLWCREAEWKWSRYTRVKKGKCFQRNLFAITLIHFINRFRLNRFLFLSFRNGNWVPTQRLYPSIRRRVSGFLMLCYLAVLDCLDRSFE